jgi:hypothetical protein
MCMKGWWGDLRERHHLLGIGRESKIILKWISKKWIGAWGGLTWFRIGKCCCECGNEPRGSMKFREFHAQLRPVGFSRLKLLRYLVIQSLSKKYYMRC